MNCNEAGCDLSVSAKGLCKKHYARKWSQDHKHEMRWPKQCKNCGKPTPVYGGYLCTGCRGERRREAYGIIKAQQLMRILNDLHSEQPKSSPARRPCSNTDCPLEGRFSPDSMVRMGKYAFCTELCFVGFFRSMVRLPA